MEDMKGTVAGHMLGDPGAKGIRKLCSDAKRCGLGMICEHAQIRGNAAVDIISAWTTGKSGECGNYFPRTELGSTGDIPKPAKKSHRDAAREAARNLAKGQKPGLILPPHLQKAPDLQVSRHIKKGIDIKKEGDPDE